MSYNDNDINTQQNNKHDKNFTIIIVNENKKVITNKIYDLYKYNVFSKNNKTINKIIEVFKDDNIFFKIHLFCEKETDIENYNKRYNLLITFDNLLKKFMKKKYKYELKNKDLCYTDISYKQNNNHIISFYVVISQDFGVFKNMDNIFILIKEFNKILKNYKNKNFGDNFIKLNIYNKKIKNIIISENLFTYVNNNSKNISIYNEKVYDNDKIFNKYYFMKNLISYSNNSSDIHILDHNVNTLNDYFKNLKLDDN